MPSNSLRINLSSEAVDMLGELSEQFRTTPPTLAARLLGSMLQVFVGYRETNQPVDLEDVPIERGLYVPNIPQTPEWEAEILRHKGWERQREIMERHKRPEPEEYSFEAQERELEQELKNIHGRLFRLRLEKGHSPEDAEKGYWGPG